MLEVLDFVLTIILGITVVFGFGMTVWIIND